MQPLISLCMIVKNEEKVLERCLNSVQGLADEIIIVDTGSIDRTKEIALKYTEHVYDFQWINDFSAARNEGLKRATGKWILVLDADEYVLQNEIEPLKDSLNLIDTSSPVAIVVNVMNLTGNTLTNTTGFYQSSGTRYFTNHKGIRYENPIHEQITYDQGDLKHLKFPYTIFHSGYVTEIAIEKKKSDRNMQIFEQLKQNGKMSGPYGDFVLANELIAAKKPKEALYYYKKCLNRTKITESWYAHCFYRLVSVLRILNRYNDAYSYIEKGIQMWSQYTDFYYLKGAVLSDFGLFDFATEAFESCLKIAEENGKRNKQFWLIDTETCRYLPYVFLAKISYSKKDIAQTVFYLTKVLQENPKSYVHLYRLTSLLIQSEHPEQVSSLLEQLYPQNQPFNSFILFQVCLDIGHQELALMYFHNCSNFNLAIEKHTLIRLALLSKDRIKLRELMEQLSPDSDSQYSYALIAALVFRNVNWVHAHFKEPSQPYYALSQIIVSMIKDHPVAPDASIDQHQLYSFIVDLFKLGYFEEFDLLINNVANHETINMIADFFYDENLLDFAIDYYSILINNNALSASGYMNLANLYCSQNEMEEGLKFLQKSIDLEPALTKIPLFVSLITDLQIKREYIKKFEDLYPEYKNLSFIKELV